MGIYSSKELKTEDYCSIISEKKNDIKKIDKKKIKKKIKRAKK